MSASTFTSSSRLSEIYSVITNAKINEFSAVKHRLDTEYASILAKADAAAAKGELLGELDALVQGLKDLTISQTKVHPDVEHLEDVVKQLCASRPIARPATARHLIARLRNEIAQGKRRTEYALLYGKVLEEHARVQDKHKATGNDTDSVGTDEWDASVPSASVAAISAKYAAERKATLAEFADRVFTPPATPEGRDSEAFAQYLRDNVFHLDDPAHRKFLDDMRAETTRYGEDLIKSTIAPDAVRSMILALLQTDLLDASRQNALREIKDDAVIHGELAAVLNMQLTNLGVWSWPKEGMRVDMRRAMNGKFRMYMDEDLVTALWLQWVGVVWSIRFKQVFERIHTSVLWSSDEERKEATKAGAGVAYRANKEQAASVAGLRREFVDSTFMAQLPGSMADQEGDQCAYDENDDDDEAAKSKAGSVSSAIKRKQDLVHLLGMDAWFHRVTTADKPDADPFVVVRTDFEWFGPSLPHGHLIALLDFFGVPQVWRDFFQRFLAAPLLLPILDQPAGEYEQVPRVRAVGVPMGHSISVLLGETMLFVLDYSVVRVGSVTFTRLHDDIWLWGSKADAVKRAWGVCELFAKVAGLAFNKDKSGSVALGGGSASRTGNACAGLPEGSIAWGFLKLGAGDGTAGKWTIDHGELDTHVSELRARLDAAPTVLTWVNSYNKYTRFIMRNCGSITQRDHALQVIDALTEFHKRVFPATAGNPVRELVKHMSRLGPVASAVNAEDVQDAFAHWPLSHGGVELFNPFIEPMAVILNMDDEIERCNGKDMASEKYIREELLEKDLVTYRNAKKDHQGKQAARLLKRKLAMGDIADLDVDSDGSDKKRKVDAETVIAEAKAKGIEVPDFPEQDAWINDRRESHFTHWYHWYTWARAVKEPKTMDDMATSLGGHLDALATEPRPKRKGQRGHGQTRGEPLHETSAYWSWVVGMYGESLVSELGSLSFIPSDVVPRAMVQSVKREKIAQDL